MQPILEHTLHMKTAARESSGKIKRIVAPRFGEERYETTLPCGLFVSVAPRRGFAGKFAMLGFKFGAIDQMFELPGNKSVRLPEGTAHFLEHQLFKKKDGDLSDAFGARGAVSNAQTTHTTTSFHFEGVGAFEDNLETLFRLGFEPWFDKALVDVERGIIVQELVSYRDHPHWMSYQSLMSCMYHRHPVRVDIVGTEESLARMTPAALSTAHSLFYHPANAGLFVSGDVDPHDTVELAHELATRFARRQLPGTIKRIRVDEPASIRRAKDGRMMQTALPHVLVGYKDAVSESMGGEERLRRETEVGLVLDLMYGRGTAFFDALYGDGVVTGDFSASYHTEADFGYAMVGGETTNPDELVRRLEQRLAEFLRRPVTGADLERKKRKIFGRFLRNFESAEATAFAHHDAWLSGVDVFDFPRMAESITAAELLAAAKKLFAPKQRCVSLVSPRGKRSRAKYK